MCFTSSRCQQPSRVTCQKFHLCYLFPLEGKVCYVEYSEARNREEHPAQIKLTNQRSEAVTRGSALALHHGGRIPGISLGQVRCQIPSLCCCQSPPPRRLHQKPSLRFPSPSSVAALSIISYSQQTLLLIMDVNLWVACSPP